VLICEHLDSDDDPDRLLIDRRTRARLDYSLTAEFGNPAAFWPPAGRFPVAVNRELAQDKGVVITARPDKLHDCHEGTKRSPGTG
jgi:hypothetical protein